MKLSLLSLLKKKFPDKKENELYGYILCGNVYCDGEKVREPARKVDSRASIGIFLKQYVSRGGYKLEGALDEWNIECRDKVFVDGGASTGGFTDCLLQRGARAVHAVDVGWNQLAYSLRKDERVYVREKCNVMELESLDPVPHMAVADLSFRSITGAAKKLIDLTSEKILIALIKPQFEVENSDDFNGVINDPDIWRDILEDTARKLSLEGLSLKKLIPSKITGKKGGNQEFLGYIGQDRDSPINYTGLIEKTLNLLIVK